MTKEEVIYHYGWNLEAEERDARSKGLFDVAVRWQNRLRWCQSMGRQYDTGHRGDPDRPNSSNLPLTYFGMS